MKRQILKKWQCNEVWNRTKDKVNKVGPSKNLWQCKKDRKLKEAKDESTETGSSHESSTCHTGVDQVLKYRETNWKNRKYESSTLD